MASATTTTAPVPPAFTVPQPLTAITVPPPSVTNTGADDMQRSLRIAMRIPAANRTVADFLFTGLTTSAFHSSYLLPPSAIATSLALRIEEHINGGGINGAAVGHGNDSATSANSGPFDPNIGYRLIFDSLFIPVCYTEPYAMGYAFNVETGHENSFCLPGTPFESPCVGRFVFDTRTGDILKVSHGGSPQAIGLHSMHSKVGSDATYTCDHEILIVPSVPYEWPYLPSTVLWKVSTRVVRDLSNEPKSLVFPPQPHLPPIADRTPFPVNTDGFCADGSSPSRLSNPADSLFASQPLQTSLSVMSKHLCGQFKAPGFRLDVLKKVLPTQLVDSTANNGIGKVIFMRANTATTVRLREHFASAYYLASLSPSSDASLVVPSVSNHYAAQTESYNFNQAHAYPYFNNASNIPAQEEQQLQRSQNVIPAPISSCGHLIDIIHDTDRSSAVTVKQKKHVDQHGVQPLRKFVLGLRQEEEEQAQYPVSVGVNSIVSVATDNDKGNEDDPESSNETAKDRASSSAIELNLDFDYAPILDGMGSGGPNLSHDANVDVTQFGSNEILQDMLDWLPSESPVPYPSSSSLEEEEEVQCDEYVLPQSRSSGAGVTSSSSGSCEKGSSSESLPIASSQEDIGNEEGPVLGSLLSQTTLPHKPLKKGAVMRTAKRLAPRPEPAIQPRPSCSSPSSQPDIDDLLQLQLQLQPQLQPPSSSPSSSPPPLNLTQTQPQRQAQTQKERKSASPNSNSNFNASSKPQSDLSRKEMLEARRRRNRISAARSNERKRLMLEQLKRDMQTSKERAEELKAVEQRALLENQRLKSLLLNKQWECST